MKKGLAGHTEEGAAQEVVRGRGDVHRQSGPPHGWRGKEGPAPEWTAAVGFRSDLATASRARENEKG